MRAFDLMRDEDETGISGTGRVAEGVIFDDGHVVMRWLTAHRSTTFFPSIETVELIHGHGGRTRIVFQDGAALVKLPKPHLALGNEGEYADASKYDQGGGLPADLRAHIAYDRLGAIEAPPGWTAGACWFSHGDVSLHIRSSSRYLGTREESGAVWVSYERQHVHIEVSPSDVRQQRRRGARIGLTIRVGGVEYQAEYEEYSTLGTAEGGAAC